MQLRVDEKVGDALIGYRRAHPRDALREVDLGDLGVGDARVRVGELYELVDLTPLLDVGARPVLLRVLLEEARRRRAVVALCLRLREQRKAVYKHGEEEVLELAQLVGRPAFDPRAQLDVALLVRRCVCGRRDVQSIPRRFAVVARQHLVDLDLARRVRGGGSEAAGAQIGERGRVHIGGGGGGGGWLHRARRKERARRSR